jgi:pimeloyl-ACP methyl ester carboxylesterase
VKIKQSFLTLYNKERLRLIGLISSRRAAVKAWRLMCTPFNGKNISKTPALFDAASPVEFFIKKLKVKGFHFKPEDEVSNDKKILICHGFDNSSYRFAKYVPSFLKAGFHVFAFDAPGHGFSDGKTVNAFIYRDIILEIESLFGPFYGIMAHSLGALAASLAAERLSNPDKKLVLIAPATEVKTIFKNFFKTVPLTRKTKKAFDDLVYEKSGQRTEWFSVARAVQNIPSSVLWIHDTDDQMCPYEDTLSIRQKQLPNVQFITTNGLGHTRIYISREVQNTIVNFFIEKD